MKRVLIVDDDEDFIGEISETLQMNGYDTLSCPDGESAVREAKSKVPDVILLDLKMDGMSGFQVANKLYAYPETRNIPIIAITAYYTEKEHVFFMQMCRITKYLIKPFNPPDMIAMIENVLGGGAMCRK